MGVDGPWDQRESERKYVEARGPPPRSWAWHRNSETGRPATTWRVEGQAPTLQLSQPVLNNTVYKPVPGTVNNSWGKRGWEWLPTTLLGPFPLGETLGDWLKSTGLGFLWFLRGPLPSASPCSPPPPRTPGWPVLGTWEG